MNNKMPSNLAKVATLEIELRASFTVQKRFSKNFLGGGGRGGGLPMNYIKHHLTFGKCSSSYIDLDRGGSIMEKS